MRLLPLRRRWQQRGARFKSVCATKNNDSNRNTVCVLRQATIKRIRSVRLTRRRHCSVLSPVVVRVGHVNFQLKNVLLTNERILLHESRSLLIRVDVSF